MMSNTMTAAQRPSSPSSQQEKKEQEEEQQQAMMEAELEKVSSTTSSTSTAQAAPDTTDDAVQQSTATCCSLTSQVSWALRHSTQNIRRTQAGYGKKRTPSVIFDALFQLHKQLHHSQREAETYQQLSAHSTCITGGDSINSGIQILPVEGS